jgi:hypothetical protein
MDPKLFFRRRRNKSEGGLARVDRLVLVLRPDLQPARGRPEAALCVEALPFGRRPSGEAGKDLGTKRLEVDIVLRHRLVGVVVVLEAAAGLEEALRSEVGGRRVRWNRTNLEAERGGGGEAVLSVLGFEAGQPVLVRDGSPPL